RRERRDPPAAAPPRRGASDDADCRGDAVRARMRVRSERLRRHGAPQHPRVRALDERDPSGPRWVSYTDAAEYYAMAKDWPNDSVTAGRTSRRLRLPISLRRIQRFETRLVRSETGCEASRPSWCRRTRSSRQTV